MMTENNRLDIAMASLNALGQPGTDLEGLFAAMQLNGLLLTGASVEINSANTVELIGRLLPLYESIRDAETERILGRLRKHEGKLPESEIIEARRHRDWFVPRLMQECQAEIDKLKQQPDSDDRLSDDEYSDLPFFALFLFSEWEIGESLPIILEGLSLPGEGPFELFGDGIHEQVSRYLAQFLSHDLDQIDEMICDPRVNMYVRWAATSSYRFLSRDKKVTMDDAIARLERSFHKTKVIGSDDRPGMEHCYELSAGILDNLYQLGGSLKCFLGDDMRIWDFVEESVFCREDSDVTLTESERQKGLLRLPPTRVSDCLETLRHWATFEQRPEPSSPRTLTSSGPESAHPFERSTPPITSWTPNTTAQSLNATGTIRAAERVPRNAKCPCGSGKKFKQCCMRG